MTDRERRAYPRQPTSLAAQLHVFGYGKWPCEIRDYCPGGLFLALSLGPEEELLFEESVQPGTPVEIRLNDHRGQLTMSADVARISQHGIGVQFPVPNASLAERLRPAGAMHEARNQIRLSREAESVLSHLRNQTAQFIDEQFEEFLLSIQDELISAAGQVDNNKEQGMYFDAMSALRDAAKALPLNVGDLLQEGMTTFEPLPAYQMNHRDAEDLELVNDRDFEHWLAVSELASTATNRLRYSIDALQQRLSALTGKVVDLENNPIAPENLCRIISSQLQTLEFSGRPLAVVYRAVGRCLIFELGTLYDALNAQLVSEGVLPELSDEPTFEAQRSPDPSTIGIATEGEPQPADAPATAYSAGSLGHLDGLAQLFGLRKQVASSRAVASHEGSGSGGADRTRALNHVLDALVNVPVGESARGRPLRERVLDSLEKSGHAPAQLGGQEEAAIGLTSELIAAVDDDELVHSRSRKWFRQLEGMIARLLLEDSGFIQEKNHPLREAMDEMGQVYFESGLADSRRQKRVVNTIDKLIEKITQVDPKQAKELKERAQELNAVLRRMNKTRQRLEQRAVEAAQGKDRLEKSRTHVNTAVNEITRDRALPVPIQQLFDEGWSKLLVLSHLRNGSESGAWKRQIAAVERMVEFGSDLTAKPDESEIAALGTEMQESLGDDSTSQAFIEALYRHLKPSQTQAWHPVTTARAEPEQVAGEPPSVDSTNLGRVKLLRIGEWICVPDAQGEERPVRLIWRSDDEQTLVFVNRTGRKVINFGAAELARALEANKARILDNFDMPLLDRSWQSLLQKMHSELATEAVHDPLTGLLNRQAFERHLSEKLTAPQSAEQTHGLFYVGLDGFKLVNTTMGLNAGDDLLTQVSRRLKSHMNDRSQVARVGGDEFCILMTDCTPERAERYAQGIRELISENDFVLNGEKQTLNASVGAALLDSNVETAQAALRLADQACDAAKAAGGNRVFTWQSDNQALRARERGMIWAKRIDDALRKRELQLVAQRIAPTEGPWGHGAYYEVLVRMKAGKEGLTSPAEFIPAAERFGKIATLDRWIITEALAAMDNYWPADLAGLTINVSGQSLSQNRFMDFLEGIMREHQDKSQKVCFEITETATINNLSQAADFIFRIKQLGCGISLDDFGSGMSSYGYLKNLPVDFVKIDGQFVREIETSMPDFAVVRSINELGHFLGKRTIAEHVEKVSTLEKIKEIGVDFVQGYGIEGPRPLDEILAPQLEKAQ